MGWLREKPAPPERLVGDYGDVLSRIAAIASDPDERQTFEDRQRPPVLVRFVFPIELLNSIRLRRARPPGG